MAITLPSMAQWTDEIANLTQLPTIGLRYLSAAPIFRAFGVPSLVDPGKLKVKWSDGVVSNVPATSAGMGYTGTVGQINDKFTLDFSVVAAPASVDLGTEIMGPSFGQQSSMALALAGIYDKWVNLLVAGTGAGVDYDLWSANEIADNGDTAIGSTVTHLSGSYTHTEYSADKSVVLDVMEQAAAELPTGDGSYNVCLCDTTWLKNVKREIRKTGGNTASDIAQENFGLNTLMHDGILYFPTRHLTSYKEESKTYLFNVGPSGCQLVVPTGQNMFKIQGPKFTEGNLATTWDIALVSQIVANTPRSVMELKQIAF